MPPSDRFTQHGPLKASPDRTHLIHADGTPFFLLSDTAWNGALLSTDQEWATYLQDRAAKGFTAIQFITHAPWTGALTNLEGQTALNSDGSINPAFFDRIERRMHAIEQHGLLSIPVLAWAASFRGARRLNIGHTASAAKLIPFLRYQIDRLSKFPVIWVLAGDGVYRFWRARKWKRVARALFTSCADRAPVTLHPAGLSWPYRAFKDEDWLDLYGYQSSHSEHPATLNWLQRGDPAQFWKSAPRPTINLEPVYEDIAPGGWRFDRIAVRRAIAWSLLNAPTAGVSYGAHGLWGWHDQPREALNHRGMGKGLPWHQAMNLAGSADAGRIARFFTSFPWHTLTPDPALLASQPGDQNPLHFISSSRISAGDLALFYTPIQQPIPLRTNNLNPNLHWTWFNPSTNDYSPAHPAENMHPPANTDHFLVATASP